MEQKAVEYLKVEYKVKKFIEDILNIKIEGGVIEAAQRGVVVEFLNFLRPPPVKYNRKPSNNYQYMENINFFNSICLDKTKFKNTFTSVDVVDAANVTKPISTFQLLNNLFRIIRFVQLNNIIIKPLVQEQEIPQFGSAEIESAVAILNEVDKKGSNNPFVSLLTESKKEEEAAKKLQEEEEAAQRAAEEEERKKVEAARKKEEEARKKESAAAAAARKKREEEEEAARKKKEAEEEAARKKQEEEAEAARKKQEEEDAKQTALMNASPPASGRNIFKIELISGKIFHKTDLLGLSDPFVVAKIGKIEKKTTTKSNTLNPQWKEVFTIYNLKDSDASITLTLYDYNRVLKNELIGTATLSALDYRGDGSEMSRITLPVSDKKGKIVASLLVDVVLNLGAGYVDGSLSSSSSSSSLEGKALGSGAGESTVERTVEKPKFLLQKETPQKEVALKKK